MRVPAGIFRSWAVALVLLSAATVESSDVCNDAYGVERDTYRPLAQWSLTEVQAFVGVTLGMPQYTDLLSSMDIDGNMLLYWWERNTTDHELRHLSGYKRGISEPVYRAKIVQAVDDLFALDAVRQHGSESGWLRASTPELIHGAMKEVRSNISCTTVCHQAPMHYPHVYGVNKTNCGTACVPNFETVWSNFTLGRGVSMWTDTFVNISKPSNASSCFSCLGLPEVFSTPGKSLTSGQVSCRWCEPSAGSGYCYNVMANYDEADSNLMCYRPVVSLQRLCEPIGCDGYALSGKVFDRCGVCGGNGSTCVDACGVSNGDNSTCTDACGVLFGNNDTCWDACFVPWGDNSTCMDACLVVHGDNSSCWDHCHVPWGDNSTCWDACFIPHGDNTTCAGCDGVPWSGYVNDTCQVCAGDNSTCAGCDGVPNSGYENDTCLTCGGTNTSCGGCDGVPHSGLVWDFCHVCDGDNSTCLLKDCDGLDVPVSWLGDGHCDDGSLRQLIAEPNATWVDTSDSWWIRCLTEAYSGLVALLPFCYGAMNYIPFYECRLPHERTPAGKQGCVAVNGSNHTNGTNVRTQRGELIVSEPRNTSWYTDDGATSWWEACSITPADPQCAAQARVIESDKAAPEQEPELQTPPSGEFVDFRDLVRPSTAQPVAQLAANFKCAARNWDNSDCCPSRRTCRDCTNCGAGCVWCTSPFGDSHCFDNGLDSNWPYVNNYDEHPLFCGLLGTAMRTNADCDTWDDEYSLRGTSRVLWVVIPLLLLCGWRISRWRQAAHIREAFEVLDADQNMQLDEHELGKLFEKMGLAMKPAQIVEAKREMDSDWSGGVGLDEFSQWWFRHSGKWRKNMAEDGLLEAGAIQKEEQAKPPASSKARDIAAHYAERYKIWFRRVSTRLKVETVLTVRHMIWVYERPARARQPGAEKGGCLGELSRPGAVAEAGRKLWGDERPHADRCLACCRRTSVSGFLNCVHAAAWLYHQLPRDRHQCMQCGANPLWIWAVPLFLAEVYANMWNAACKCKCSLRCLSCSRRKSTKKYEAEDAQGKGGKVVAREQARHDVGEPPSLRPRGRPPWIVLGLGAYGSFGGMIAFAAYAVWRVAPQYIPDTLLMFNSVLLAVCFLSAAIFGLSRWRPQHAAVRRLSKGRRWMAWWEMCQMALLHLQLKQGLHGGLVGRALAELALFNFVGVDFGWLVALVLAVVTAARAGRAAYFSFVMRRSGLLVPLHLCGKGACGWMPSVVAVTVVLRLTQAVTCSLREASTPGTPEIWDGLGLSGDYLLDVDTQVVCWEGSHRAKAFISLVALLAFAPAVVWVELSPDFLGEPARVGAYFGLRASAKIGAALASVVGDEPQIALLSTAVMLVLMVEAQLVLAPCGALHDDFDGNFLLFVGAIVPLWIVGSLALGLAIPEHVSVVTLSLLYGGLGLIALMLTAFFWCGSVGKKRHCDHRRWRLSLKAVGELQEGIQLIQRVDNDATAAGKTWDELEAAGVATEQHRAMYPLALQCFDAAKLLMRSHIALSWRAFTLERLGLFQQARQEAENALEIINSFDDVDKHFTAIASMRLDVEIPMPSKDDLTRLMKRLDSRLQLLACSNGIRMAQFLLAERMLEVEPAEDATDADGGDGDDDEAVGEDDRAEPVPEVVTADLKPGKLFRPCADYGLCDWKELERLYAFHCGRALANMALVRGGSRTERSTTRRVEAWVDVQHCHHIDQLLHALPKTGKPVDRPKNCESFLDDPAAAAPPAAAEEEEEEKDLDRPVSPGAAHQPAALTAEWLGFAMPSGQAEREELLSLGAELEGQRPQMATALLRLSAQSGDETLIAHSLALCPSWRAFWMRYENGRSYEEKMAYLELAMECHESAQVAHAVPKSDEDELDRHRVNRPLPPIAAAARGALEPEGTPYAPSAQSLAVQFDSTKQREYHFAKLEQAVAYRELDMLHARAVLHAANGQPLTGAVDLDMLNATRGRRYRTLALNDGLRNSLEPDRALEPGQPPPTRPAYILPLLWNRAVMLEAGGDLLEAQEAFLELQRLLLEQPDGHSATLGDEQGGALGATDAALSEFGLPATATGTTEPPLPLVLQHMVGLLRGGGGGTRAAAKGGVRQPGSPFAPAAAAAQEDMPGRLDFQLVLPGGTEVLPHRHLASKGFDFRRETEQSLERLRGAQAVHAEKRLSTHHLQNSTPATIAPPPWHEKQQAEVRVTKSSLLHRGAVRPRAPQSSKDGIGVVRRQTGLRMALPVITSNS